MQKAPRKRLTFEVLLICEIILSVSNFRWKIAVFLLANCAKIYYFLKYAIALL